MNEAVNKKTSLSAKIAGGVSVLASVSAAIVLVIILTGGNGNTNLLPADNPNAPSEAVSVDLADAIGNLPDPDALSFILSELNGYWISGQQFVEFSSQSIKYGLLQSGFMVIGQIISPGVQGENSFYLELFVPARAATEMDEERPARSETVYVDISNFTQDNRINIKTDNLVDGQWHTYEFGGKSLEEIN